MPSHSRAIGAPCVPLAANVTGRRITVNGRVQGVGFRPAVARLAKELGLAGCVRNTPSGVEIEVEGDDELVCRFQQDLPRRIPARAELREEFAEALLPQGRSGFAIEPSSVHGALSVPVPTDIAVCRECLLDVGFAADRRHAHALASCTACGPRYSIITAMPYDRAGTSLASFDLCLQCRQEYATATDRRFHAQTNACPKCGPHVWLADGTCRTLAEREVAVERAACMILAGSTVAIRGMGGYQLIVDAMNDQAVERLRDRKARPAKPLAVLVESLDAARRIAMIDEGAREALTSPSNPIVVVPIRSNGRTAWDDRAGAASPRSSTIANQECMLAASLSGKLNSVGIMLPTTPLHWRLASACRRPLAATSGNRESEPLAADVAEAQRGLGTIADYWLHHDREIVRPIDDSVVRVMANRPVTLRLARGMAPLQLALPCSRPLLALGGHQKAAVAFSNGAQAVLGPHLGDLDGVAARERFVLHLRQLIQLYGAEPECLVHDQHPDYFTTRYAAGRRLPTIAVQHHHAHIAAGMLEQGWLDRTVLGVAFDGTGYGDDGSIWGGEFLLATAGEYRRVGHLRSFRLPGGEAAVREPWRVALSLVAESLSSEEAGALFEERRPGASIRQTLALAGNERLSPLSTSAGRLFDAAASLILGIDHAQFEGQPAMLLESVCEPSAAGAYDLPSTDNAGMLELDWRPLVAAILADRAAGVSTGTMAMRFHRGIAAGIEAVCRRFADFPVVLGGGVFQNRLLVELLAERWPSRQELGLPGVIPPNDGGLAAGQLAVATARMMNERTPQCA